MLLRSPRWHNPSQCSPNRFLKAARTKCHQQTHGASSRPSSGRPAGMQIMSHLATALPDTYGLAVSTGNAKALVGVLSLPEA